MAEEQRERVPVVDNGELATATAFLDFARHCLVKKVEGLDDEQVRRVLVPTGTNLLGLLQHMAVGERYWFAWHLAGHGPDDEEFDFTMDVPPEQDARQLVEAFRAACAESDRLIARAGGMDALTARPVGDERRTLRWVLTHVTTETTRHAGHADILRELLDGVTGR